ncbi:MAG: helicase-related protein [Spirochaetaceae bacterium]|nr:helicase-related protein [Spirochaetaceae bacterium]
MRALLSLHRDDRILVMAMYVDQIKGVADALDMPVLTGASSQKRRDALFQAFRDGEVRCLAVSKIGSLAIDLPDANVAIQISGTFGSRQEEAQRLGRILRPKRDGTQAHFYSLVSAATVEQEFAMNRQRFLCEQGYEYAIADAPDAERVTTTAVAEAIAEAGGTVPGPSA